jgi:hypothetical protein
MQRRVLDPEGEMRAEDTGALGASTAPWENGWCQLDSRRRSNDDPPRRRGRDHRDAHRRPNRATRGTRPARATACSSCTRCSSAWVDTHSHSRPPSRRRSSPRWHTAISDGPARAFSDARTPRSSPASSVSLGQSRFAGAAHGGSCTLRTNSTPAPSVSSQIQPKSGPNARPATRSSTASEPTTCSCRVLGRMSWTQNATT